MNMNSVRNTFLLVSALGVSLPLCAGDHESSGILGGLWSVVNRPIVYVPVSVATGVYVYKRMNTNRLDQLQKSMNEHKNNLENLNKSLNVTNDSLKNLQDQVNNVESVANNTNSIVKDTQDLLLASAQYQMNKDKEYFGYLQKKRTTFSERLKARLWDALFEENKN